MCKKPLNTLPFPAKKNGWPWKDTSVQHHALMPRDTEWPKISIVTPSYNQGGFIEETIRSVFLQKYPNLEYIIIDGGSTDKTLDIIKKYEPWIKFWVSEEDSGQSDAINKGFAKSSGQIMGWVNSDDILLPDTLYKCATHIDLNKPSWLTAPTEIFGDQRSTKRIQSVLKVSVETFFAYQKNWIPQPSTFWNRLMWDSVGVLDTDLHYVMDVDLWFRMLQIADPTIHKTPLSRYREHANAKSIGSADKSAQEYSEWFCRNFLGMRYVRKGRLEIDLVDLMMQSIGLQLRLQHLENHAILGRFVALWGKYINPRFKPNQ